MKLFAENRTSKIFMLSALFIILGVLLWNGTIFYKKLKEKERNKMKIWAKSQQAFVSEKLPDYIQLNFLISTTITDVPYVLLNSNGQVLTNGNIPEKTTSNPRLLKEYHAKLLTINEPIILTFANKVQFLYYGTPPVLNQLKFYPLLICFTVFLLLGMVYFFFNTSKVSEQNKLWAGMAKETAHQIGTPLSSLVGWTEILKSENVSNDYLLEMEKDILRLQTITERFSKIGSVPSLELMNIVSETKGTYDYLKTRSSKLVNFKLEIPSNPILVMLNKQLYSWTIENLVKNAIDAMKGKGDLEVRVIELKESVKIQITDTGSGIPRRNFKTVFKPGFTSKKRGWGLGLSLAKRIIVDYHDGNIKVAHSEIGKGTTFQISLQKC